jgi:hypothetical protein
MKKIRQFFRWFDLKCGWFFINGHKQDDWAIYLKWREEQANKKEKQ